MTRNVHVETGAAMALDDTAVVWCFDLDLWGQCVQAATVADSLAGFTSRHGDAQVAEMVDGDEQAFLRDLQPVRDDELDATRAILTVQRQRAIALLTDLPDAVLDRDDPTRLLPSFARWRTIRQMLWHIADTESRVSDPGLCHFLRCVFSVRLRVRHGIHPAEDRTHSGPGDTHSAPGSIRGPGCGTPRAWPWSGSS